MKTILTAIALCLLTACGGGGGASAPVATAAPIQTAPTPAAPVAARPTIYAFMVLGQSNAAGRAEVQRLKNTAYVSDPAKVKIYDKGNTVDVAHITKDNGKWVDYSAGFSSNTDGSPLHHFGPELALSQKIVKDTGSEVYIVKAAFGGTALTPGIATYAPGNWTDTVAKLAMDHYFTPAMRDLRAQRPDADIKFLGVVWWQGENDAIANISGADYNTRFASFKAYADNKIAAYFTGYKWAVVGLSYMRTPQEADLNRAKCSLAAGSADSEYVPTLQYPSKMALTEAQRAPILVGSQDDEHSSYIGQVAVGEASAAIMMGTYKREACQ